ncbi:uncharacterized protein BDZ99DRAFT_483343 [Mytilinidion resinicola]|uniref:Uncharacterized protein n=1 Tax=Mytilinidion resinicola TaxID=574789 RepID=A0A6A6XZ05_9PEZI|nr:uncharacterized protein BDZ99DRAFT_483343 [Mytilinidion resinicola]KAF2801791.1 hypothetical protein BDZ99DRAFT_483343 [Mytilinidion resinicola]
MPHKLDPPKWNVTHFDFDVAQESTQNAPDTIERSDVSNQNRHQGLGHATSPVLGGTNQLKAENSKTHNSQVHEVQSVSNSRTNQLVCLHAAIRELKEQKKRRNEFLKKFGGDEQFCKDTTALAAKISHMDYTLGFAGEKFTDEIVRNFLDEATSLVVTQKQVIGEPERAATQRVLYDCREMEAVSASFIKGAKWKAEDQRLQQRRLPPSQLETYDDRFQRLCDTLKELQEDIARRNLLIGAYDFAFQYRSRAIIVKSNINMLIRRVSLAGENVAEDELNRLLADALELVSTKRSDFLPERPAMNIAHQFSDVKWQEARREGPDSPPVSPRTVLCLNVSRY